jgi:hypothetical protein
MSANHNQREEVFSKSVRAGKRTYFFDVKSTKAQDYYLTITESKKRMGDDGTPFFEKHKIFLYREDFQKFLDGINEAIQHVGTLKPGENYTQRENHTPGEDHSGSSGSSSYSDVNFDDLGK